MYNRIPQEEVRDLLRQIKDKGSSKELRLQASKQLCMLVMSAGTVADLNNDWQDILRDLSSTIQLKQGSLEVKRAAKDVCSALGCLANQEFAWFIGWIKEEYDSCYIRAEDERALYISMVTDTLHLSQARGIVLIPAHVELVMRLVISCLDDNNSHVVLVALLDLSLAIAKLYPTVFRQHFEEVVDFTIGWLVERIPVKVAEKCREVIVALRPFWVQSVDYAHQLMQHFLEDISSYIDEALGSERKLEDSLCRAQSILRSLSDVLDIFVENNVALDTRVFSIILQVLNSCRSNMDILAPFRCKESALFFSGYSPIFLVAVKAYDEKVTESETLLSSCLSIMLTLSARYRFCIPALCEFVLFFNRVFEHPSLPSAQSVSLISDLVGDTGAIPLKTFNFYRNASLCESVAQLISVLLSPTSLPLLQNAYNILRTTMLNDISFLSQSTEGHSRANLVADAECRVMLCVHSLAKIAIMKNSLIVMMGLRPSLLYTLTQELPLTKSWLLSHYPDLYFCILRVTVKHVEAHDYFLGNSDWLSDGGRSALMGESLTSKHVQMQITVITQMLRYTIGWPICLTMIGDWLFGLLEGIDDITLNRLGSKAEMQQLQAVLQKKTITEKSCEKLIAVANRLTMISSDDRGKAVDATFKVAKALRGDVLESAEAATLWRTVDSRLFIRSAADILALDHCEMPQTRVTGCTFCSEDFVFFTDFMLKRIVPSYKKNPRFDDDWLTDSITQLYGKSQRDSKARSATDKSTYDISQKWRWALAQVANYCIENRMKTALGKPMDTFNCFGLEVQRLAKEALGMKESPNIMKNFVSDGSANNVSRDDEDEEGYGEARSLSTVEEWWRVRCLIEFISLLDKMIFNARSGTIFPISTVSQLARQFFITNLVSCQEWLSRTYSSAMVVAYHNGYYTQVIAFGSSALVDLEKRQLRSESASKDASEDSSPMAPPPSLAFAVLGWMARAMAELGGEQSARGLRQWALRLYKVDMEWLEGTVCMASADYEGALKIFRVALEQKSIPDSAKTLIRAMCLDALSRLRLPLLTEPQSCPSHLCLWSDGANDLDAMPAGFDADSFTRVKQLCSFGKLDNVKTQSIPWDLSATMESSEMQLMQTLRRVHVQDLRDTIATVGSSVLMLDTSLKLHGRVAIMDRVATAVLTRMNKKNHQGDVTEALLQDLSSDFLFKDSNQCDIGEKLYAARRLNLWTERLGGCLPVHQETARLARKTGNACLAMDLFGKTIASAPYNKQAITRLIVASQKAKLMWKSSALDARVVEFSTVLMSMAAAFEFDSLNRRVLDVMSNTYNNFGDSASSTNGLNPNAEAFSPMKLQCDPSETSLTLSRAALNLARWLEEEPQMLTALPPECRTTMLWSQLEGIGRETGGDLVSSLLAISTRIAPQLAKAHLRLADWTYKSAEGGEEEKNVFDRNYKVLLGSDVSQAVLDSLWTCVTTAKTMAQLENGVFSALSTDRNAANSLLLSTSHFTNLWSQITQRRSVYYNFAISEYFSFISQSGTSSSSSMPESTVGSVSATLRVLGLLVKYSNTVYKSISDGLNDTNELLWKDILPQLFSRLSHPVREVRDVIVKLLCRICRSSPHSMVFQVVAGTSSSMLLDEQDDVIGSEEDDNSSKDRSLMFECCNQLVVFLQQLYPTLVKDVREFVTELHKINLLYEERWVFVLSNLDHEMDKRLEQIRCEAERSRLATHLDAKTRAEIIDEKTRLIVTSVYRILRDLYERTCEVPCATANEHAFVDAYGSHLKAAFELSQANKNNPEKAWAPFKQILGVLLQKNARRGGHTLYMSNISNVLANMDKSSVPIPGQEDRDYSEVVSVAKLGRTALVLPTKTRPKKITLVGSDGKDQMFLFKGQEDLHLDERIMQLLHICNLMLSGSSKRSWPSYSARNYAVTPLGTRSGLIQWVGGATPMFHLYRKWQMRESQAKQLLEKKLGSAVAEVERPTDLYQKTLRMAFAQNNVEASIVADRTKWPHSILKDVLFTLIKETPKDLLSRELWMRAGGGDTWWRVVCRLSRSSAVMSMIGAILGLGDRHLDNLLVNLDRGDIVHIDYNICFDKGKHLRVPETVPFRLTQNLAHAMGPTQVEGMFRESCAHVLATLREGREILLTVLDAFVYDPLVDWAASDHLTSTSAAVGVAVTLAVYGTDLRALGAKPVAREMFSVRVKEQSIPWMKNGSDLNNALHNVKRILEKQFTRGASNAWENAELIDQERVEAGRSLKAAISTHHQIMKDFRPLLRALATCDDRFASFMREYREKFSEPLVRGHQLLDALPVDLPACIQLFEVVLANVDTIYTSLLELKTNDEKCVSLVPSAESTAILNAPPGLEDWSLRRQEQEQNAHAKNVVKRVRARLEGKVDGSESKKVFSNTDQADYLIRQATSNTLMSLMYEGWTAWV